MERVAMIVLDTHVWVWWAHGDNQLTQAQRDAITTNETDVIGVSAISCWEIAKLVEYGRLQLPSTLEEWFDKAFSYPGLQLLALTPEITIEFQRDPADQMIVATARVYGCPLVTSDEKILNYSHVTTIS